MQSVGFPIRIAGRPRTVESSILCELGPDVHVLQLETGRNRGPGETCELYRARLRRGSLPPSATSFFRISWGTVTIWQRQAAA